MSPSDNDPRILVIVNEKFKKEIQMKALKQGKSLSDIIRSLLTKWLEGGK